MLHKVSRSVIGNLRSVFTKFIEFEINRIYHINYIDFELLCLFVNFENIFPSVMPINFQMRWIWTMVTDQIFEFRFYKF